MSKNTTNVSDDTQVAMPLRNILSIIAGAAIATWAYFGIIENWLSENKKTTQAFRELELSGNEIR